MCLGMAQAVHLHRGTTRRCMAPHNGPRRHHTTLILWTCSCPIRNRSRLIKEVGMGRDLGSEMGMGMDPESEMEMGSDSEMAVAQAMGLGTETGQEAAMFRPKL